MPERKDISDVREPERGQLVKAEDIAAIVRRGRAPQGAPLGIIVEGGLIQRPRVEQGKYVEFHTNIALPPYSIFGIVDSAPLEIPGRNEVDVIGICGGAGSHLTLFTNGPVEADADSYGIAWSIDEGNATRVQVTGVVPQVGSPCGVKLNSLGVTALSEGFVCLSEPENGLITVVRTRDPVTLIMESTTSIGTFINGRLGFGYARVMYRLGGGTLCPAKNPATQAIPWVLPVWSGQLEVIPAGVTLSVQSSMGIGLLVNRTLFDPDQLSSTSTTTTTTTIPLCEGVCKWDWNQPDNTWELDTTVSGCNVVTSTTTTSTSTSTTTTTEEPVEQCECDPSTSTTSTTTSTSSTTTTTTEPQCECQYPIHCGVEDGECTFTPCTTGLTDNPLSCYRKGACCVDGVCTDAVTEADCTGVWTEDTLCADVTCSTTTTTEPVGACCYNDGVDDVCDLLNNTDCTTLTGTWYGAGSECNSPTGCDVLETTTTSTTTTTCGTEPPSPCNCDPKAGPVGECVWQWLPTSETSWSWHKISDTCCEYPYKRNCTCGCPSPAYNGEPCSFATTLCNEYCPPDTGDPCTGYCTWFCNPSDGPNGSFTLMRETCTDMTTCICEAPSLCEECTFYQTPCTRPRTTTTTTEPNPCTSTTTTEADACTRCEDGSHYQSCRYSCNDGGVWSGPLPGPHSCLDGCSCPDVADANLPACPETGNTEMVRACCGEPIPSGCQGTCKWQAVLGGWTKLEDPCTTGCHCEEPPFPPNASSCEVQWTPCVGDPVTTTSTTTTTTSTSSTTTTTTTEACDDPPATFTEPTGCDPACLGVDMCPGGDEMPASLNAYVRPDYFGTEASPIESCSTCRCEDGTAPFAEFCMNWNGTSYQGEATLCGKTMTFTITPTNTGVYGIRTMWQCGFFGQPSYTPTFTITDGVTTLNGFYGPFPTTNVATVFGVGMLDPTMIMWADWSGAAVGAYDFDICRNLTIGGEGGSDIYLRFGLGLPSTPCSGTTTTTTTTTAP